MKRTPEDIVRASSDPAVRREEILRQVKRVPAMPASANRVLGIVRDPGFDIAELSRAIEYDPGLALNVLKLANSAYFGCSRMIGSVRDAIVRLGTDSIVNLVITTAVAPMASREVGGYDLGAGALWDHSISVAIGAEQISKVMKLGAPDYTFTAGLLHDIGKIVLGTFVAIDVEPIKKLAFEEGVSFEVAEKRILGIDHAEVGAALLECWNLPQMIEVAVRWHHNPSGCEGDKLVADIVHVANSFSMLEGLSPGIDEMNYGASREATERLGIKTKMAEKIICETVSRLDEVREWFADGAGG